MFPFNLIPQLSIALLITLVIALIFMLIGAILLLNSHYTAGIILLGLGGITMYMQGAIERQFSFGF